MTTKAVVVGQPIPIHSRILVFGDPDVGKSVLLRKLEGCYHPNVHYQKPESSSIDSSNNTTVIKRTIKSRSTPSVVHQSFVDIRQATQDKSARPTALPALQLRTTLVEMTHFADASVFSQLAAQLNAHTLSSSSTPTSTTPTNQDDNTNFHTGITSFDIDGVGDGWSEVSKGSSAANGKNVARINGIPVLHDICGLVWVVRTNPLARGLNGPNDCKVLNYMRDSLWDLVRMGMDKAKMQPKPPPTDLGEEEYEGGGEEHYSLYSSWCNNLSQSDYQRFEKYCKADLKKIFRLDMVSYVWTIKNEIATITKRAGFINIPILLALNTSFEYAESKLLHKRSVLFAHLRSIIAQHAEPQQLPQGGDEPPFWSSTGPPENVGEHLLDKALANILKYAFGLRTSEKGFSKIFDYEDFRTNVVLPGFYCPLGRWFPRRKLLSDRGVYAWKWEKLSQTYVPRASTSPFGQYQQHFSIVKPTLCVFLDKEQLSNVTRSSTMFLEVDHEQENSNNRDQREGKKQKTRRPSILFYAMPNEIVIPQCLSICCIPLGGEVNERLVEDAMEHQSTVVTRMKLLDNCCTGLPEERGNSDDAFEAVSKLDSFGFVREVPRSPEEFIHNWIADVAIWQRENSTNNIASVLIANSPDMDAYMDTEAWRRKKIRGCTTSDEEKKYNNLDSDSNSMDEGESNSYSDLSEDGEAEYIRKKVEKALSTATEALFAVK